MSSIALLKTGKAAVPSLVKTKLFLIGGDPFLRAQQAEKIISEFEKQTGGSLSSQVFRPDEISLESILAAARTLPFLAKGQVIRIQSSEKLKSGDLELLENYCSRPAQSTLLIFEADSLEGKTELQRLIAAKGRVITPAKEEARSAAQAYLHHKLAKFKKTMTPPARQRIFEMCGEAVVFLDSMLDRLIQYAGDRSEIDEEMVAEFTENWADVSIFQLTDAILVNDRAKAVKVLRALLESSDSDPKSLIGIIHWQMRQLWQGAALSEAGVSEQEIFSRMKVPAFRKQSFFSSIKRYGSGRLERAIEALYQLDKKAKAHQVEAAPGIESWLLEFVA
ncbi:MAG: DNA polymerase III subunit delta [Candidatus Omnitrophica bacterium ADurb.Bin277]|nr:MAG: DNA polymerase III subunit delta [Candidatus Omnitrophica bacterium ADurb.Bin277]